MERKWHERYPQKFRIRAVERIGKCALSGAANETVFPLFCLNTGFTLTACSSSDTQSRLHEHSYRCCWKGSTGGDRYARSLCCNMLYDCLCRGAGRNMHLQ